MDQEFPAIFEHGILRPLFPVDLPESAEVIVSVRERTIGAQNSSTDPLLGFMSDEAELMDVIAEEAMLARESVPFRTNG